MKYRKYKGMENEVKEDERPIIMIVDDESGILKELETLLSRKYKIKTASNGQQALDIIHGEENPEQISLIILDQRMPGMSGVELLKELVHEQIMPDTLRIIITAHDERDVILAAVNEAHIYGYIKKPYDPDALYLTVQRAVEAFYDRQELKKFRDALMEKNEEIAELKKKLEDLKGKYDELNQKYESLS